MCDLRVPLFRGVSRRAKTKYRKVKQNEFNRNLSVNGKVEGKQNKRRKEADGHKQREERRNTNGGNKATGETTGASGDTATKNEGQGKGNGKWKWRFNEPKAAMNQGERA